MPPRVPCGYRQRPRYKFQNLIGLAIASRNGVGASTAVSALQIIRPILVNDGLYHFVNHASCPTFHPISRCPGSGEWGGKLVASSIFILNPVLTSGGVHILGHARVITIQARLEQHHFWLGFRLRVACEPHHELVVFEVRSVLVFDGRILPVLVPGTSCLVPWYVRELNVRVRECTRAGQLKVREKKQGMLSTYSG